MKTEDRITEDRTTRRQINARPVMAGPVDPDAEISPAPVKRPVGRPKSTRDPVRPSLARRAPKNSLQVLESVQAQAQARRPQQAAPFFVMPTADGLFGAMQTFQTGQEQIAAKIQTGLTDMRRVDVKQYRRDFVGFVHDCFNWDLNDKPTPYQDEIMEAVIQYQRVAVRGPHGLGKTALGAWFTLWMALCYDGEDWKVPTTASVGRQLTDYLWPEIHKWARRLRWDVLGRLPWNTRTELLTLQLKGKTGAAFALTSDSPARLEGAHATVMGYLFDEAKTIDGEVFDAAEGAFSTAGADTVGQAYVLAISTPGEPSGRFYEICRRAPEYQDWHPIHVNLEQAIQAGRISREWANSRATQWGETSAVYQNRVLGEFAAADEDGIIPLAWIEAAVERWHVWKRLHKEPIESITNVGVDVATSGLDKTVMALRKDEAIAEIRRYTKEDTMETVGRVKGIVDAYGGIVVIDGIGIGAGCVHRLREQKVPVDAFIASEKAIDDRKRPTTDRSGEFTFVNRRAEAWWNMREALDPAFGSQIALPPDDLLLGDLTAPHYTVVSGAKIRVEEKDEIRKRIHRSTDTGDAVVQTFAPTRMRVTGPGRVWFL